MEAAISCCHSGIQASTFGVVRTGEEIGVRRASRNSLSIQNLGKGLSHSSAFLRIEVCRVQLEERRSGRREVKVRYAPKPNSVAEAQRRFDSSNLSSDSPSALKQERKVEAGRAGGIRDDNNNQGGGEDGEYTLDKFYKMARVSDRLIEVFMIEKTAPKEWRKLLAFSEEWPNIGPHFFQRCSTNAAIEEDPKKRGDLLKLARKLKEVSAVPQALMSSFR